MSASHNRHEAECVFCDKKIIRFINRKPIGDWLHEESRTNYCLRGGKVNDAEVATPKPRTIRSV